MFCVSYEILIFFLISVKKLHCNFLSCHRDNEVDTGFMGFIVLYLESFNFNRLIYNIL